MNHQINKASVLKAGDTIGIITPSAPINTEWFAEGIDFLQQSGFEIVVGDRARLQNGHLAGTDYQRAMDLNRMFADPTIHAVFCSNGGANSNRILHLIDYNLMIYNPKILLGLSDPTVLLAAIHAKTGLVTFHGPVVQFDMRWHYTPFTQKYMKKALQTTDPIGEITELSEVNILRKGKAQGRLIGGNLTSLQYLLGTPYEPNWQDCIFFWEDIFEEIHNLDAKLTHFKQAGVFDKIKGMVVGTLVECHEEEYPNCPPIEEIVLHLCHEYDFPILWDVNLGHTQNKLTLPLGVMAEINTTSPILQIIESGVVK